MGSAVSRKKKKKFKLEQQETMKNSEIPVFNEQSTCLSIQDKSGNNHRMKLGASDKVDDYGKETNVRENSDDDNSNREREQDDEGDEEEEEEKEEDEDEEKEESEEEEEEEKEEEEEDEGKEEEEEEKDEEEEEEKEDEAKDKDHKSEEELGNTLSYSETTQRALVGDLTLDYPSNVKVVRIFTSSTFTDTFVERNTLMERVYPRLKDFCQERGYDFQVVDMRWGVRDEATDDHMTSELCMKEIFACQKLSTGPNFVTFLGQKYGYRPFPPKIAATEFEKLLNAVDSPDDRSLLTHWFRRDDNCVPPEYLLQPITSLLPDYRNYEKEDLRKKASGKWWAAFERMQVVFRTAADKVLTKTAGQKYVMSVTEEEIRRGVITAPDVEKHCLWFKRTITNLRQHTDKPKAGSFIDKTWGNPPSIDEEAQKLLTHFREEEIPQVLPETNIKKYDVKWSDKGIEPTKSTEHAQYIENLCTDFYEALTRMITEGITEKEVADTADPLAEEIFQHSSFCQSKSKTFHGRKEFLKNIKETITTVENRVIVLHGASGCGKTSVMAKVATELKSWFEEEGSPTVVLRFIGTSPDSSSIRLLLKSVCLQLCKAAGESLTDVPEDMKSLVDYFPECLEKAAEDNPVVLVLDSLDQLSIDEGGREMGWLPKDLPYNVYVVLSTLPNEEYQCLGNLKIKFPDECFKEVPPIPLDEADQILDSWLKNAKRSLLPAQKKYVMDAFMKCQLPLYLKLAFDEAVRWKSYSPPDDTKLAANVQDIINALFDRIERVHGKVLVRHAFAYITASKNGLTESELEDLLSLDDTVLNDVYQYWTPPVRRLPPLLWIRIRSEINEYLIDRGADGTRVIYWYHRQFIEVARERYLESNEAEVIHFKMSEYFLGTWCGNKKPYVDKSGKENAVDRLVAKQPLMFDTSLKNPIFNLRKLNELPFHLLQSQQFDKAIQECLCNFEFLLAKLRGLSLEVLLNDFSTYLDVRPEDADVKLLYETLRLATYPLKLEPKQLPSQLLGRMFKFLEREKKHPFIYKVLKQAQTCSVPCFIPNMKCLTAPGGALVSTIPLSGMSTDFVSIASDNKTIAITNNAGEGLDVKIVDCNSGRDMRKFTLLDPTQMYSTNFNKISDVNKNHLFLGGSNTVYLLNTLTGKFEKTFEISDDEWFGYSTNMPICFPDEEKMLAVIGPDSLIIWRIQDAKLLHKIKVKGVDKEATELGSIHSLGELIVYNVNKQSTVHVVNAVTGKEVKTFSVNLKGKKDQASEAAIVKEVKLTADGQVLVLPSSGDQLRLYDLKSGALVRELNEFKMIQGMGNLQLTEDGKKAVGIDMYEISITDLQSGKVEHCLRSPVLRMHNLTRDGVHFFSVGMDQVLRVFDRSREDLDENKGETTVTEYEVKEQGRSFRISDQISLLSPCSDQRHVVTAATVSMTNVLSVWDAMTGQKVVDIKGLTAYPNPLRMSNLTRGVGFINDQNGKYHYKVFNLKEGKIERNLLGKACKRMQAFGFIDQKHVISFSKGRRFLKVWNIDSGKVVDVYKFGQKHRFEEMLLSGDGKMAACSQVSRTLGIEHKEKTLPLIVFNTTSLEHKEITLEDEQLGLYNAKMDYFGRYLITLKEWYYPLLWDLEKGKLKHKLYFEDSYASFVNVSSAAMVALTGEHQGGIRVWDVESGTVLRWLGKEQAVTISALHMSQNGRYAFTQDQKANTFDAYEVETGIKLATFTIDGTCSMSNAVGNRFTMGMAENPNLIVLRIHLPGNREDIPPSEVERLSLPTELQDVSGEPVMVDKADSDKDDDKGNVM